MNKHSLTPFRPLFWRTFGALLVLSFVLGSFPAGAWAAAPAQTSSCAIKYTVQSGDTLSRISVVYDVSIEDIAAANSLVAPYTIYINQVLCIPGSTSSSTSTSSTSTTKSGTISVSRDETSIIIQAKNVTKKGIYYVKVRDGRFRGSDEWEKIGLLHVRKDTTYNLSYTLPKNLRDNETLTVCLKNAVTDGVTCYTVWQ